MPADADATLGSYDGASLQVVKTLRDKKSFKEGSDGATPLSGRSGDAWSVYCALTGLLFLVRCLPRAVPWAMVLRPVGA